MNNEHELELDLRQLLRSLWRRKWVIIGVFIVSAVAAYGFSVTMTPVYEATTTVLVRERAATVPLPGLEALSGAGRSSVLQSSLDLFRSRTLALKTAQRLGYDWDEYSAEFGAFRNSISVQPTSGSDVVRISVQHVDPVIAQQAANLLVDVFIEESQRMNSQDVRAAREFIQAQLLQFEADLEQAEENLVRYKEQAEFVTLSGETSSVVDSLTRLESMRAEAYVTQETARSRLDALRGELGNEQRPIVSSNVIASNPVVSGIRSQLASLEAQLAAAREQYTDRHPRVITLQAQIDEYRQELNNQIARLETTDTDNRLAQEMISLQAEVMAQQARIEALDRLIADREALLGDLPEKELHLTRLIRTANVTEGIYTTLLQRYEEMRINEAMESANVSILDPAIVPRNPVKPRVQLNVAIAGLLGLFVGVGIAFVLEYLDTTFKDPDEIEGYIGLPVLGKAPRFEDVTTSSR